MLVVSEHQVKEILRYEALIPVIRQALIDFSAGRVLQPLRTVLSVTASSGWFGVMPAVYGSVMGAKMVTFYPGNAGTATPTHMAVIQLFRSDTGEPLAVMDARLITEMRTAAVSAVAADLLACPGPNVLAILGSGVQARSHFKALSLVRPLKDVRVWSPTQSHAQQFASEIGARFLSAEQAVDGADLVLTATSSAQPVLFGKWLKRTALVVAIGGVTPDRRELNDQVMLGPVVVESREAAMKEPGDIVRSGAKIAAEIGELLNGGKLAETSRPIVFKSVGIAVEDIAAAKLVYDEMTRSRTAMSQPNNAEQLKSK